MSKDRCIGIFFLLLFLVLWFWLIPIYTKGPVEAAYPRFASLLMLIPAVGMILRKTAPENILRLPAFDLHKLLRSEYACVFLLIVSYPVYLVCVQIFGFYTAGFAFCVGWMIFFGERALTRILLTPLLLLGSIYGIVTAFLRYPLPAGMFF